MDVTNSITQAVAAALKALGVAEPKVTLEHPGDLSHGDYSTNVALAYAKELKSNPRALADKVAAALKESKIDSVEFVEIAGPGFINFRLSESYFPASVKTILASKATFGTVSTLEGEKILIEHTQPNAFKEFHIGHLMNNAIGEAISRTLEACGAEVRRATYHGDVGLHVAKTIWGLKDAKKGTFDVKMLGKAYAAGHAAYESDEAAKAEIVSINKSVYARDNADINKTYDEGRAASFAHFEELYKRLGSRFDYHFYESETGPRGRDIVLSHVKDGIFEESEGAVVFKGEKYGLHTRVFVTKEGLPTYEAKDIGLTELKEKTYASDLSLTVTANEQDHYFKVVRKAIELVFPRLEGKVAHFSHGMLKLTTGKMSSRTGSVVSAESLLSDVEARVLERVKERGFDEELRGKVAEEVSLAAIKYAIVKQAVGTDIIFDFDKSVSFEGDSGPYLQYSHTRALSAVRNAAEAGIAAWDGKSVTGWKCSTLEKLLYRFPEIVERSGREYQPHHIATYLTELASAFNGFYGNNKIVDVADPASPYKVALTEAFAVVMRNGLKLLGIGVPEKM